MKQASVRLKPRIASYNIFLISLLFANVAYGLPTIDEVISSNERLIVPVNQSQLVRVKSPVTRISIVETEIADVQILDPEEILINGKTVGQTTLIVWQENGNTSTIDVLVTWNTRQIEETIQKIIPGEYVEVVSLDDAVALRGHVSDIEAADRAVEIAQSFVPKIVNLLQVPGTHQVLLEVKIAEVSRSFRDEKGINFHITDPDFVGANMVGDLISANPNSSGVSVSDSVTQFFSLPEDYVSVFIDTLRENGLLEILAEPNLIARSGENADFLVGGEFPIPVAQGGLNANAITIEYKEFGIRLDFTPTVVSNETIHLDVSPEVSDLDFGQGIKVAGFDIPTLITRRAHTVVKLNDGQTFAIAGLISRSKESKRRKSPPMSGVPILGGLFRGHELRNEETELLIMVTPHLIAPIEPNREFTLPGESEYSTEVDSPRYNSDNRGRNSDRNVSNVNSEFPVNGDAHDGNPFGNSRSTHAVSSSPYPRPAGDNTVALYSETTDRQNGRSARNMIRQERDIRQEILSGKGIR